MKNGGVEEAMCERFGEDKEEGHWYEYVAIKRMIVEIGPTNMRGE